MKYALHRGQGPVVLFTIHSLHLGWSGLRRIWGHELCSGVLEEPIVDVIRETP